MQTNIYAPFRCACRSSFEKKKTKTTTICGWCERWFDWETSKEYEQNLKFMKMETNVRMSTYIVHICAEELWMKNRREIKNGFDARKGSGKTHSKRRLIQWLPCNIIKSFYSMKFVNVRFFYSHSINFRQICDFGGFFCYLFWKHEQLIFHFNYCFAF